MISSKFYSQLSVCPNCQGWGLTEIPYTKLGVQCSECLGFGVTQIQSENVYVWDAPTHVDYKNRNKITILKIVAVFIGIFVLVATLVVIRLLLLKLIQG